MQDEPQPPQIPFKTLTPSTAPLVVKSADLGAGPVIVLAGLPHGVSVVLSCDDAHTLSTALRDAAGIDLLSDT